MYWSTQDAGPQNPHPPSATLAEHPVASRALALLFVPAVRASRREASAPSRRGASVIQDGTCAPLTAVAAAMRVSPRIERVTALDVIASYHSTTQK